MWLDDGRLHEVVDLVGGPDGPTGESRLLVAHGRPTRARVATPVATADRDLLPSRQLWPDPGEVAVVRRADGDGVVPPPLGLLEVTDDDAGARRIEPPTEADGIAAVGVHDPDEPDVAFLGNDLVRVGRGLVGHGRLIVVLREEGHEDRAGGLAGLDLLLDGELPFLAARHLRRRPHQPVILSVHRVHHHFDLLLDQQIPRRATAVQDGHHAGERVQRSQFPGRGGRNDREGADVVEVSRVVHLNLQLRGVDAPHHHSLQQLHCRHLHDEVVGVGHRPVVVESTDAGVDDSELELDAVGLLHSQSPSVGLATDSRDCQTPLWLLGI